MAMAANDMLTLSVLLSVPSFSLQQLCAVAPRQPACAVAHPPTAPRCYKPTGEECSWYRDCLEVRYPCEGSGDGYAIEYAERFCSLYYANYNHFSSEGKVWMDGVRKCLQRALAPSLHPFAAKNCSSIRRQAIDSHPGCYTRPAVGVPGICELLCADVWRAIWIVVFEGGALFTEPFETLLQTWLVIVDCSDMHPSLGCFPSVLTGLLPGFPHVRPHLHLDAIVKL